MIYLDNAATSFPKPPEVARAMAGVLNTIGANPGRSGHRMALAAGRVIYQCRELLAEYLGIADSSRIVFCSKCTDALNTAIHGALSPGDHVISTLLEHNSVLRPLSGLFVGGRIQLTLLSPEADGTISAQQVQRAIKPNTRLVACTHMSNVTGALQPVTAIGRVARAAGALFLVDAAQSAGKLDVRPDALGADLLAMPGHKGLMGPHGTGVLYVRPGVQLTTLRQGGTGSLSESMLQPEDLPDRFESGTQNLPGIAGLLVGVRFVRAHQAEIVQREAALAERLLDGLANTPRVTLYSRPGAGVVSFNVGQAQSGLVAEQLDQANVAVRGGLHCAPGVHQHQGTLESGAVRASPGFFNTERDVDTLLRAVRIIAHNV